MTAMYSGVLAQNPAQLSALHLLSPSFQPFYEKYYDPLFTDGASEAYSGSQVTRGS